MAEAASRGSTVPWRALTWATLALAALVARAEAGAVSQEVLPTGQYSVSGLYGVGQVFAPASPAPTLNAWAQASHQFSDLWIWLSVQAGFDAVFIAGYVGLGLALRSAAGADAAEASRWRRLVARWRLRRWWPLFALALVNLIQDAIAVTGFCVWIRQHRQVPGGLAIALEAVVIAKWALAVVLVAWLTYRVAVSSRSRDRARLIVGALKKQRFSLVIVALLAVIAIGRGTDALEQFPDVQRAWLTWPPSLGWLHLAVAVTAQVLLAIALVLLSAMRVQRAVDARVPGDGRDVHSYLPWLVTSAAVPAAALVLWLTGTAAVSWRRVIAVPAVLGVVAIISGAVQLAARKNAAARAAITSSPRPAQARAAAAAAAESREVDAARTAGDMLAVGAIAVTGLGLVRSFTGAAMVVGPPYSWAFAAAVAAGFAVAVLSWVMTRGWLQWLAWYFYRTYHSTGSNRVREGLSPRRTAAAGGHDGDGHDGDGHDGDGHDGDGGGLRSPSRLLAVFAAPFIIADVLLIFLPLWTTHWLGALGTTVIALGTLAVGLAVLAYLVQSREPLPVFRLLRLKATPVITVILLVALAGALVDTASALHDIRLPPAVASSAGATPVPPGRAPALMTSLQQWLADPATASCAVPVPVTGGSAGASQLRVEPLVLVAAAGGGIRAAWWTVQALDRLAATPCRRHAVFAASGVSGGSVGLAITAATGGRNAALARIAGPDALAAVMDGLLLRDTIAGFTGLDLTAAGMPAGQRFPDRAALMEHVWESEDPGLAQPFPMRQPALPWLLMFNSTAVGTGCRAIIADRRIAPASTRPATSQPRCDLTTATQVPDSYDFFAELPCLSGLDTATAAMLSARFAFVTPSGVVNGCGASAGTQAEQYVDGGYADSTGLATLAGLAPQLTAAIRQHNEEAMTSTPAGRPVTLVVPVTVYLGNSPQPEPVTGLASASPPQPLVPVQSGASGAHGQLSNSTALLQQLSAATSRNQWLACPPGQATCLAAQSAVAAAVPQQLILVVPREYPSVAPPLGWVLSPASRSTLTGGVAVEASSTCPDPTRNHTYCPAGIGRLGDLLRLIDGRGGTS
jgi:hypothetical protein